MGVYVQNDILNYVSRRLDLETEGVECMWFQFKRSDKDTPLLIGFVYRNPASLYSWYDDFVVMMDGIANRHPKANYILMGDFNIDLFKPQPSWESTFSLYGLKQLVTEPTRVTPTSSTLLDHIYPNNENKIVNVRLSDASISDHSPILCTWSCKPPKNNKANHTIIVYRCFKKFDHSNFLSDLNCADFTPVYNCSNSNDAVTTWYNVFLPIVDKHAPLRKKRVKQQTLPGWLNKDIIEAMEVRDKLKKEKTFAEYNKQRNIVSMLVTRAKQKYFDSLINNNSNTGQLLRAMNDITNKSNRSHHSTQTSITP
jgi:hypothetical protein